MRVYIVIETQRTLRYEKQAGVPSGSCSTRSEMRPPWCEKHCSCLSRVSLQRALLHYGGRGGPLRFCRVGTFGRSLEVVEVVVIHYSCLSSISLQRCCTAGRGESRGWRVDIVFPGVVEC